MTTAPRAIDEAQIADADIARAQVPGTTGRSEVASMFVLRIGPALLAVPAQAVERVLDDHGCSPIPAAPPHVLGVFTHGDRVLGLIDLAKLWGLPTDAASTAFHRVVVLTEGQMTVGVRADVARGVVEIEVEQIGPVHVVQGERLARHLRGEMDTPWGVAGVLDVRRLLEAARVRPA